MTRAWITLGVVCAGLLGLPTPLLSAEPVSAESDVYTRQIKPLLKARCYACHGALKQEAGLRLDTAELMRTGGDAGPVIVPRSLEKSRLLERVSATDLSERMPPDGEPLAPDQITLIRIWIEQGAAGPEAEQAEEDPRKHWSFLPPQRPAVPQIAGITHPVDAFLLARLQQENLVPRPLADKEVLLRRVTLDLIGLPPTRAELQAFLTDQSPTAYETVVDRLLQDPRYGERWARHWMDVWRYADWHGRRYVPDVWNSAPQIWRWRDWIVRSLNQDHGYDRLVREMLAADEIAPEDPAAQVATGYLIRNWYALNPNDWMRSNVEHTGKAFLGLTLNCAHCHDHKYDPITQDDYFQFRAFFEPIGIRQDRLPSEADPGAFQEYDYSTLRKVQRLGTVAIFDKQPEAPTWFYTGGDERNRVKDRGSMPPSAPQFLLPEPMQIAPVKLPAVAWYPALRPEMTTTLRNDLQTILTGIETELAQAMPLTDADKSAAAELQTAEAEFTKLLEESRQAGQPGALAGQQSLLFDATAGRRLLQYGMTQLKSLDVGATLSFQVQILKDTHWNFQFAKDISLGHTAGYVAFEGGRILSYHPGGFQEFEVGKYDLAAGQNRFLLSLEIDPPQDRCLLSVRSLADDKLLIDKTPVALNGWNPVGNALKPITFDARPGSIAVLDELHFTAPIVAGATPERLVSIDFEAPLYRDGADLVGVDGWGAVPAYCSAPATSLISQTALNTSLAEKSHQIRRLRRIAQVATLRQESVTARQAAAKAQLASFEARLAASQAQQMPTPPETLPQLQAEAIRLEREALKLQATAGVLAADFALATAEAKPMTDAKRAAEIDAAGKQLTATQAALSKAQQEAVATTFSPLGPQYPATSTGRRKALAEWITQRQNPLAARVAVNHIWLRHFQAPLVATVSDFGRNGARPTHPELLDWLAVEFMEHGWSMKHLHRLIVTSAAYRRVSSTGGDVVALQHEPENKLLWRMNLGRMEAEAVRDSLLYCAGKLDLTIGGQELENAQALTTFRRTLYYSCQPEIDGSSEFGMLFDAPNPADCYRRTRSIIPQQALALTNSDLIHTLGTTLTAQLQQSLADQPAETFVTAAFETILTRAPRPEETAACLEFLERQRALAEKKEAATAPLKARESLIRALLNHNDFVTIR